MLNSKFQIPNSKFIIIFCIFSLVILIGCQRRQIENLKEKEVIPVKVIKVKCMDIYESLEYVGSIKAEDEAMVYPKVSGKVIQKVKEENSSIEKGEAILYIDRDEVGLKFEKAPVESPLSGVVGKVFVDIGANVNPQIPVALVVNMDKVKINLEIPEKYIADITLGLKAKIKVDAYPEKEFLGEITKISPIVDLTTRAFPIEITVNNQEHLLKSGMFAKVILLLKEHKNVPVILKEAIIGKEPDTYVYVIENNFTHLKRITLGIKQGPYYEVKEGIKENDLVVILGQQRLYENASVTPEIEGDY